MSVLDIAAIRSAFAAVLSARDLSTTQSAAREGLGHLDAVSAGAADLLDISEAASIANKDPSTIRRWATRYRLGRKLGANWLLSRRRFNDFIERGAR